ncbi:MAG: flagellin [Phycisphaerales bacterium]|nr:flagellin [Phycisphaerales bacterium]
MSRINTNVSSLIAQRVLGQQNLALTTSLERLSTGLRINRGKDDPAGLIASENLRSEKAAISAALTNASRAEQVVNVAEGGLQEVSILLTEMQGLVTTAANTAGLSDEEKDAAQLQLDSILQTIDRIAGSTSFEGMKLLNGNLDYTVSSLATTVSDYEVRGAKLSTGGTLAVEVIVTTSAQTAGMIMSTNGALDLGTGSTFTIEIAGEEGTRELSFASGTTVAQMVTAINTYKDVTGVSAAALSSGTTDGVELRSTEYGSDAYVSVKVIDDGGIGAGLGLYGFQSDNAEAANTTILSTFALATNAVKDDGQDVGASINGITATTDGKTARINSDFLDVEITLTNAGAGAVGSISAFTITGGGADFQLSPSVDIAGKVSIGMSNVAARTLGSAAHGYIDDLGSGQSYNLSSGDLTLAQKVVSEAIKQVSSMRGRLGAFQKNVVGATNRSLAVALENTTSAESVIRDTDFASETANLTRAQILVNAATNVLSIANSQPQNVLTLLG